MTAAIATPSVPAAGPEPAIVKFGLYVSVTDLERSRTFYEQLFGKAPYVTNDKLVGFDVAGGLFAAFAVAARDKALVRGNGTVPYIRVASARSEYERVRKLGARMLDEAVVVEGPIELFRFEDPDGNVLEFVSLVPKN